MMNVCKWNLHLPPDKTKKKRHVMLQNKKIEFAT
jgi:hypothetical protein